MSFIETEMARVRREGTRWDIKRRKQLEKQANKTFGKQLLAELNPALDGGDVCLMFEWCGVHYTLRPESDTGLLWSVYRETPGQLKPRRPDYVSDRDDLLRLMMRDQDRVQQK